MWKISRGSSGDALGLPNIWINSGAWHVCMSSIANQGDARGGQDHVTKGEGKRVVADGGSFENLELTPLIQAYFWVHQFHVYPKETEL